MERRYISDAEVRATKESRTIEGYAVVFNKRSEKLGWFTEIIAEGALDEVIDDDVRALVNHDPTLILARTKTNSLFLEIDKKGLKYRFEAPNTTAGNDLLENVRNGNIDQSSFGFKAKDEEWTEEKKGDKYEYTRTILKFERLFDVSPVTFPAYTQTSVQVRSLEDVKKEHPEFPSNQSDEDFAHDDLAKGNESRLKYIDTIQKQTL